MKATRIIPFLIVLALLSACTPKPEQLAPYIEQTVQAIPTHTCLLYTSPSPRDRTRTRMPSSA